MFEVIKFFLEIKNFYKEIPVKQRGYFFQDIKELFKIYTVEVVKKEKQRQLYELTTMNMEAPILRDLAENVVSQTQTAAIITFKDGTKLEILPHSAYEAAKRFDTAQPQLY
jgi:DNA-binding protein Fis